MTEHEQMVEDCEQRESRLSEWEVGYIDSIAKQLREGRSLTEKQAETLDQVWGRATARG
jgi:hypothetical protein